MASYPYFDMTITADTMQVEPYKPLTRHGDAALHFSFDGGSDQPMSIVLKRATNDQVQQIADAINAIMDGRAVTIAPEE